MKVRDVVVFLSAQGTRPVQEGPTVYPVRRLNLVVPSGDGPGDTGSVVQAPKMPKDGVDFYASGIHLYPLSGASLFIPYASIAWVEVSAERDQRPNPE